MNVVSIILSVGIVSGTALFISFLIILSERYILNYGDCDILINNDPEKSVTVHGGLTLQSVLKSKDILIPSACGGGGTCGMCKVKILDGGGPVLVTEESVLDKKDIKDHFRMACQVKVRNNLEIEIPDDIFNARRFETKVISNRNVATFIKELVLQLPPEEHLEFKAGQYIQIEVPKYNISFNMFDIEEEYHEDWTKYKLWDLKFKNKSLVERAYSMANYPAEKDVIILTIRIATPPPGTRYPPGICSTYVFNLKKDDIVKISGPYGDFLIKETDNEMCYVGGGAGMAPMRSHIFHLFHTLKTDRKVSFWYGARSKKEMFYDDEFKKIARENDNFKYTVALSEPKQEDNWDGSTGFIHQVLNDEYISKHPSPEKIEYYLCGPELMIDAVTDMLMKYNVPEDMISYDKF